MRGAEIKLCGPAGKCVPHGKGDFSSRPMGARRDLKPLLSVCCFEFVPRAVLNQ